MADVHLMASAFAMAGTGVAVNARGMVNACVTVDVRGMVNACVTVDAHLAPSARGAPAHASADV